VIAVWIPESVTVAPPVRVAAPAAKFPPAGLVTMNRPAAVPVHAPDCVTTRFTVAVTPPWVRVAPSAGVATAPAVKLTSLNIVTAVQPLVLDL
jgi:hypothetical protein